MGGCASTIATSQNAASTLHDVDIPFPKEGVTLDVFDQFIELAGGNKKLKKLTTTQVCNKFLKRMTKGHKESYCDQLKRQS